MKDFEKMQKEIFKIEKNIATARGIIADGISRYKKKKLKARSKKTAENIAERFKDLEPYDFDESEIQEAYGIGVISGKEYDKLLELLRMYREFVDESGKFNDPVVEMLTRAMHNIGDEYFEQIHEYNQLKKQIEETEKEQLKREIEFERERYQSGL